MEVGCFIKGIVFRTSSDLFRELDRLSVGDKAKLTIMRQDAIKELTILLEEKRESRV